jgi:hypothetical protein
MARPYGGLGFFARRASNLAHLERMSRPPPSGDAADVILMATDEHICLAIEQDRAEVLRCIFTHYYRANRPASDLYTFLLTAIAYHSRATALELISLPVFVRPVPPSILAALRGHRRREAATREALGTEIAALLSLRD